jgi:hypothetical protein
MQMLTGLQTVYYINAIRMQFVFHHQQGQKNQKRKKMREHERVKKKILE